MAYEDFTTYTEVDPNSHIGLVGTSHVDFQAWMNEDAYLYKDKGVDHFGTSWEHKIDVKYVSQLTSHAAALWMLSNDIDDLYGLYSASKPAIFVYAFYTGSASVMAIREYYQGAMYESSQFTMTAGTMYYLTVKRDGTALTCKIYSDSARTNLLATLSLTLQSGQPSHRYVWVADTYNSAQARWGDFDIENLDLQEGGATTYTKTYTADVLFKKLGITKTYTADTLFQKQGLTKTYTIDAILKKIGLKQYQIDAILKKLGIPKTYTIDSLFKKRDITTTYNIDILLKKTELTKNYTIDALLKKLNLTKDYPIDSLFKKLGVTKTYTVDTVFQAQGVNTYTKTYTIDALLKKLGITTSYSIDTLFQKLGLTKTYTVDSTFVLRKTKTYTLDTLLKKTNITHSYTIDTIIGQPTPELPFGGGFPFWWEKAEAWAPTLFQLFRQERAIYQVQVQLAREETVKIPAQIQLAKPSQTMIQAKPVLTARKSSFKTEIHPVLARKEKAEVKSMFKTAEPAITIIPAEIEMFTYPEIIQAVKVAKRKKRKNV